MGLAPIKVASGWDSGGTVMAGAVCFHGDGEIAG